MKIIYTCSQCNSEHYKWSGQCRSCHAWNTLEERTVSKSKNKAVKSSNTSKGATLLSEIKAETHERISSQDSEFDRVLGGGLVAGSLVLLGGEPGVGKSTLLLQTVLRSGVKSLYVSGEESASQIKLRAERLNDEVNQCWILAENNITTILNEAKHQKPDLLIIDSIQTVYHPEVVSSQGSSTQVRECTNALLQYCKQVNLPCIIIGHITKDGSLAGPKLLEHIVDTVLQFEGDKNYHYRLLRAKKNRFGSTDEVGIFEMKTAGLVNVSNPSNLFLSQSLEDISGSSICSTIHGLRPILIESQALVSSTSYATPQRSCTGFETKRLNMLIAVLEKRVGLPFGQLDVFLNLVGGIRCADPALDLSILVSILSSYQDFSISKKAVFAGEVGLTGEIRSVHRIEERIKEAERMRIRQFYTSQHSLKGIDKGKYDIDIIGMTRVEELTELIIV